jgi:hypothetical protein
MTNESISSMCDLWQSQPGERLRVSPEDLQRRMSKFERTIARRNLLEYVAAAFVITIFVYYAWMFPTLLLRLGCGLLIVGTLYVVYQLHRRASARPVPADLGLRSCADFQRAELERQREALRSVWSWYLMPFLPGMFVFLSGLYEFVRRIAQAAGRPFHAGIAVGALGFVAVGVLAVFVGIWRLNEWAANKLQAQIDQLTALAQDPDWL